MAATNTPRRNRYGVYTNQLVVRVLGTAMSMGFLAIGIYALFFVPPDVTVVSSERAQGFGIASVIAGLWALIVSWFDSDLSGVWCKPPRPLSGSIREQ